MPEFQGQLVLDFSPATRKTHPKTSKKAEKKITESGSRKSHCQIILECLKRNGNSTSEELAVALDGILTYAQVWRRMADLQHNGYIISSNIRNGHTIWQLK